MKTAVATLRNLGIRLIIYLDDLLILADSEQSARLHLATAMNLLETLGFIINLKKSVLGYVCGLSKPVSCPSSRQGQEYWQGVRRPDRQSSSDSAAISPSLWLAELLHSSSVSCLIVLPLPATGKDPGTPIGRPLRVSVLSEPGGNRGIAMLGRESYGLEWEGHCPTRPQHGNRERRLKEGLGCPLQWGEYRWPMEPIRKVSPHKLSGTSSRLLRGQMLRKGQNKHSHSARDGQCDCTYIHQQNGGTKSRALDSLSRDLWQWCLQRQITVSASYIPGILNVTADRESRYHLDSSD